jgi:hypothetical protein
MGCGYKLQLADRQLLIVVQFLRLAGCWQQLSF